MADVLATLFRFRQFLVEFGPFFLAAWLGLAVVTGLLAAAAGKKVDTAPGSPFLRYKLLPGLWRTLLYLQWRPGGKMPAPLTAGGLLLFSLVVSVPALVVTSLIGMEMVLLRLVMAVLYALFLSWFLRSILLREGNLEGQKTEAEPVYGPQALLGDSSLLPSGSLSLFVRVTWKSFVGLIEGAIVPIVIGLGVASVLTIYVPAFVLRPWLGQGAWQGPYLASLIAIPFQLTGGAEVLLASVLLVKGASLGTALSMMLLASGTTFHVIRYLLRPVKLKTLTLYLVVAWFVAGSLGVAVDGMLRLFA